MTKDLIAIHRIHRPGKGKGETEIIEPGTHFVASSAAQYKALVEAGAARPNKKKAARKTDDDSASENGASSEGAAGRKEKKSSRGGKGQEDGNPPGEVPGI